MIEPVVVAESQLSAARGITLVNLFFRSTVLLVVAFSVADVPAQEGPVIPQDKARFHLFLLVGQSNMAGRGRVDDEAVRTHPRLLMLDQSGQWVPAIDPLHFDKPKMVGVGLGKTFGLDYAEQYPGVTVGCLLYTSPSPRDS